MPPTFCSPGLPQHPRTEDRGQGTSPIGMEDIRAGSSSPHAPERSSPRAPARRFPVLANQGERIATSADVTDSCHCAQVAELAPVGCPNPRYTPEGVVNVRCRKPPGYGQIVVPSTAPAATQSVGPPQLTPAMRLIPPSAAAHVEPPSAVRTRPAFPPMMHAPASSHTHASARTNHMVESLDSRRQCISGPRRSSVNGAESNARSATGRPHRDTQRWRGTGSTVQTHTGESRLVTR
jgi:hypothetical protein